MNELERVQAVYRDCQGLYNGARWGSTPEMTFLAADLEIEMAVLARHLLRLGFDITKQDIPA